MESEKILILTVERVYLISLYPIVLSVDIVQALFVFSDILIIFCL